MSDSKNVPALYTSGSLPSVPTTALPVTPSTFVTAFVADMRMRVSEKLYTRMNAIASQHLQLHNTLHAIDRVRMARESTLAEWDDFDNRLLDEQDARDHGRKMNRLRRERELQDAQRTMVRASRGDELEDMQHQLARKELMAALEPATAATATTDTAAVGQFRSMMKDMHALRDAGREEIERLRARTDMSPAERDDAMFKINAALAQFAQHIASTGELPDDMRKQVLDAYDRA
jgi:hypothetical protein